MIGTGILMRLLRRAPNAHDSRSAAVALGRWATVSSEKEKMRRIDLANLDSCGAEDCADPYLLIQNYKDAYYLGGVVTKNK